MEINSHIFHIDTLLNIDRKVWIINKMNPNIPIYRLSEYEFNIIKSNLYLNKNNKIRYNGQNYYLSTDVVNSIKEKNLNLDNLTFSMREFLDKEIIDKHKFSVKFDNINHLKNSIDDIYLILPKWMKVKYDVILDKFKSKLSNNGFNIKGIYYIDEFFYNKDTDINIYKISLILLTHLSGYKVIESKFDENFIKYENVTYYDNNDIVVNNLSNNIKDTFDKIYKLSDKVIPRNLSISLVTITNNDMNKFLIKTVNVFTSKIVESFKMFKRK